MSSECSTSTSDKETRGAKRKRTSYGLDVKLDVIKRKRSGERVVDIARVLNIPATTVHTILKSSSAIETIAKTAVRHSEVKITRMRSDVMEIMERRLATWIDHHHRQHTPLSLALIQSTALSLHQNIRKEMQDDVAAKAKDFSASKGWFHRFQKRYGFKNARIQGETTSTRVETAEIYLEEIKRIIEEGGYSPKHVFNVDETGLYWKRMPSQTYISIKEKTTFGFKASKDRVSLLIGGNASGDKKLKPLLVYRSENPRALKNIARSSLPVIWKSQRKAWITKQIFRDWFVDYFVPEVQKYCEAEKLNFKVLLIVDSAEAHNFDFVSLCPNVKVVFLPPHTTFEVQPMDQGVIKVLKADYLRLIFMKLIAEINVTNKQCVEDFWRYFNILDCIKLIGQAWKDLSHRLMNECWKNLYPEAVLSFEGCNMEQLYTEIVNLAKDAGFNEVVLDNIKELLESHALPLTNEELAELDHVTVEEARSDDDDDITEAPKEKGLTVNGLLTAFTKVDEIVEFFKDNDPLYDRAAKFECDMKDLLSCYKAILSEKLNEGKQLTLDSFLIKCKPDIGEFERTPDPSVFSHLLGVEDDKTTVNDARRFIP